MSQFSDYYAELHSRLITGASGSGKTSFILKYLLNATPACRFLFDFDGQMAARLRLKHASTSNELENALQTRWVAFNPEIMFEGQMVEAFQFFCDWTFKAACRGPGKKIVVIDEVWKYCSPNSIPIELARLAQTGRVENIECVFATQTPSAINKSITQGLSEIVSFRLDEHLGLDWLAGKSMPADEIRTLPTGHFIARNCRTNEFLRGKTW